MPMQIEYCDNHEGATQIKREKEDIKECYEYLFESKEDMRKAMSKVCHGDLYIVGNLWIAAMKTVLVGTKMKLVPTVEAAAPPKDEAPQRPPKMKYTDLCYYKTPHYEYKEFEGDKVKCSGHDQKIIHNMVRPYVTETRKATVSAAKKVQCVVCDTCKDVSKVIGDKKKEFVNYMRHQDNFDLRRAVVAAAAISGFIIGRRMSRFKDSLHKGVILGGISALAAGALCFPKETDEHFRTFLYEASKLGLRLLNIFCWSSFTMREKIPCADKLPPEPKLMKDQCQKDAKK